MDLELNRSDYVQVDGTSPGATKILPHSSEPKGCQKVVVGSQSGVVHSFGANHGHIETVFKTLPGKGVSCIQLGGAIGSIQDKIFVAAGNEITGYTRKGKQFLKFDTNLTDNIRCMSVCGNDLAVCGEYVYNHYFECQDKNYFLSSGRINDMLLLPVEKLRALVPVLACQDRLLRVLKDSQCQIEIEVSGPVTALTLYQGDGGPTGKDVVYGTSDGKIGLLSIDKPSQVPVWEIENTNGGGSSVCVGVTCLGSYDMTGDGVLDLLAGRNDGQVEIYSFNDLGEPVLRFAYNCGESVTSVQGGVIGNARYDELLVTTYSGWVFGLSAEHAEKRLDPNYLLISPESAQKILKLKEEVEQLEQKVGREREVYQLRTYSDKGALSAVPFFALDDSFVLHHQDASYTLAVQLQTAIDTVVLQSNVPVDLLDSSKNSAVVSYTSCDPQATECAETLRSIQPGRDACLAGAEPSGGGREAAGDGLGHASLCLHIPRDVARLRLQDLKVYEGNADCLAPEYQDILARSDELEMEFKRQPCHLERLYGMITDLYIDVYKFKGTNVKSKVPALLQVLDRYDLTALIDFFHNQV
ncbi:BBSome complex member BBS7-like isoform X4 [Dermacentor variabilis]|uniref:BBSome complex member BBS7-like isoform X4 n=1 Tax=Dermacentor variabilis TaxID=34621 RepID=UPI003F5B1D66